MEASDSFRSLRSSKRKREEDHQAQKYNLRNLKISNESFITQHQSLASKSCSTGKKCQNIKSKNTSLTSHSKMETEEKSGKLEGNKKICSIEMHKDKKLKTKSNVLETSLDSFALINSSQSNVKSVKDKCHANKINCVEIFGSSSLDKTSLINSAVYQPNVLVSLMDLKKVTNSIQTRSQKKKEKGLNSKLCKKSEKVKKPSTLRMHKGRRCIGKSKPKINLLEPDKHDCVLISPGEDSDISIIYVKNRQCTNENASVTNGTLHQSYFSTFLLDLLNAAKNISSPSTTDNIWLQVVTCLFIENEFWLNFAICSNFDPQNEFISNYSIIRYILKETFDLVCHLKDIIEMEAEMDNEPNNDNESNNENEPNNDNDGNEREVSHCGINLIESSVNLNSIEARQVESNEQLCEITFAIELASTFHDVCGEQNNGTCEIPNHLSNNCDAEDTNNSTSDDLNQSLPLLENEELIDSFQDLTDSDMPELSCMSEKSSDLEKFNDQTCADLQQNSCIPFSDFVENGEGSSFELSANNNTENADSVIFTDDEMQFLKQTKGKFNLKQNRVVNAEDLIKSKKQQLMKPVIQEIEESRKDEINLDDLINCFDDYDDCVMVEKCKQVYNDRYKCGKCCKFFELKTAHLHKNCDVRKRIVPIGDINFICIKCLTLFENLSVLSTHRKKCLSANKSTMNKSRNLNEKECIKSLTNFEESDCISTANISKENLKSYFSCHHIDNQKSSAEEDPESCISLCSCPESKKQITDKHAQEQHHYKVSTKESENNSGVIDSAIPKFLSPSVQNNQRMRLDMNLQNSQCLLTHPLSTDFIDDVKSNVSCSEMPIFIENMTECGLLYSPNEGAKFFIPLSCKFVNDALRADLQNYFPNFKIKKEPIENCLEEIPAIPNTCINCKKPLDLKFDLMFIDKQVSLPDNCNGDLLQLKLPCSSCEYLYPVVFWKDILDKVAEISDKYNLDKFTNSLKNTSQEKGILIKQEHNKDLHSTESDIILPRIEQVVTISSDDFYKWNENEPSDVTEDSVQQEKSDLINLRMTVQNANLNMNGSAIPKQIVAASTVSHNEPLISLQAPRKPLAFIPSEIILENDFFSEPDLYTRISDSGAVTYICGECFTSLEKKQIADHFYEKHNVHKNKFIVASSH